MKISVAMSGVSRLAIDSAPFIYLVERRMNYSDRVNTIFRAIRDGDVVGLSSVITLTEVLSKPIQQNDSTVEAAYRNMLLRSQHFRLISITSAIADRAAQLRAAYNLKTPDALQIATAIDTGCNAFLTNDKGLKRVKELSVIVLDELEPDE
jgi:predicted nucleic acid-binding protein